MFPKLFLDSSNQSYYFPPRYELACGVAEWRGRRVMLAAGGKEASSIYPQDIEMMDVERMDGEI